MIGLWLSSCDTNTTSTATEPPNSSEQPTPPEPKAEPKITVTVSPEYLQGKIVPSTDKDIVEIDAALANKKGLYMRAEAYEAFRVMHARAKKDGVDLKIVSALRTFAHQKRIWEAKWTGARKVDNQNLAKTIPDPAERALKILEYSSMPGTSRHHWGTDIDINNLNNSYFATGKGLKEYTWLVEHGPQFGFCQVYSPKGKKRKNGYEEEKWHWSFLPTSKQFTYLYKTTFTDQTIDGFKGAEAAVAIKVIEKYVLGINPDCL